MTDLAHMPTSPPEGTNKDEVKRQNRELFKQIAALQDVLYAQGRYSLLVILQGLDASGKNSATKKIFRRVNPIGLRVTGFSQPTETELKHDFLWRIHRHAPMKGMIRVFNRSHYDDVVVTRVKKIITPSVAQKRFEQINQFEDILKSNDTAILKFYLHVSEEEQKKRLKKRLQRRDKHWKFSEDDLLSSQRREEFLGYYQEVFKRCGDPFPWTIVPADKKWYARRLIASGIVEALKDLPLEYPPLDV